MSPPPPALLLVGHGTRDSDGQREFTEVARKVAAALPGRLVVSCCLELTEPTIAAGVRELVERGAQRFVVVPVLLFAGGHARQDIPAAVAQAAASYPALTFTQAGHLGCQGPMLQLSADRFRAAQRLSLDEPDRIESIDLPGSPTYVVMVGRGGTDGDAREEMRRFVALRMQMTPAAGVTIGYLAGDGPTLAEALDAAERSGLPRIVVQPHLLFQGRLVAEVRRQAVERASGRPDLEWFLADHLGPADEVIVTLLENYAD